MIIALAMEASAITRNGPPSSRQPVVASVVAESAGGAFGAFVAGGGSARSHAELAAPAARSETIAAIRTAGGIRLI